MLVIDCTAGAGDNCVCGFSAPLLALGLRGGWGPEEVERKGPKGGQKRGGQDRREGGRSKAGRREEERVVQEKGGRGM